MPLIEEIVHHPAATESSGGDDAEPPPLTESSSGLNLNAAVQEIEAHDAEHGWQTLVEDHDGDAIPAVDEDGNVLSVFGEQSMHNYPDIHSEWGDVRHGPLAARRPKKKDGTEANPYDAHAGGWNTEYRAQLEHAMDMVKDSRQVMKNIRELRRKQKEEEEEGVQNTYVKGQTAKEASEQWERERAERAERMKSKALAVIEAEAAAEARALEVKAGEIAGVKPLPEWVVKGAKKSAKEKDGDGSEFDLAAAHREWIEALGARDSPTRTRTRSVTNDADESGSDRGDEHVTEPPATPPSGKTKAKESNEVDKEVEDAEGAFFRELSSLSPYRRAQASRTEERDFWNEDVYGGDENDDLAAFEQQMSQLCASEISSIKRVSVANAEE